MNRKAALFFMETSLLHGAGYAGLRLTSWLTKPLACCPAAVFLAEGPKRTIPIAIGILYPWRENLHLKKNISSYLNGFFIGIEFFISLYDYPNIYKR
ncbi:hypothetical protein CNR22_15375 [Sphingobacteriaceae bacterium]|nr:hypothetical protein CNR22_15375 [Sphingobacteriaceae bacterium]